MRSRWARADLLDDRRRARLRLGAFLWRHNLIYRGQAWTVTHQHWLQGLRMEDRALQATLDHYRAVTTERDVALQALEAELADWVDSGPFAEATHRLGAYRGIAHLGARTIASEVGDWRRFGRGPAFMGFTGLVPTERSSGETIRRGHITKAGSTVVRCSCGYVDDSARWPLARTSNRLSPPPSPVNWPVSAGPK
jgi:transposase